MGHLAPLQLAGVMLCWLLGVALQYQQTYLFNGRDQSGIAIAGALMVLMTTHVFFRHQRSHSPGLLQQFFVCVAATMLGWGYTQWQATSRWEMRWPDRLETQSVLVTGQIDSMPKTQEWGQQFEVRVDKFQLDGQQCYAGQQWGFAPGKCPERILLNWGQAPDHLLPGQTWRWRVKLHAPDGLMNPGGFDAQRHAFVMGIRAQGKVSKKGKNDQAESAIMLADAKAWEAGQIDRWRHQVAQKIVAHVPSKDMAGLLVGLTVGQQSAIGPELWNTFRNTGIAHLVSISGVHITMLGWLMGWIAGALWRLSPQLMHLAPAVTVTRTATLFGALGYAIFAGWGVPAQRTVWMLALVIGIRQSGRRWPFLLVLLLAAVGVTLFDPWALVQASFWLSFAAVGLLMLASERTLALPDAGWMASLKNGINELWRTQWVATLGLAPLTLIFFQTLSVVGFLTNLVCIPLFTLLIAPLSLLGMVWPGAWDLSASLLETAIAFLTPLAQHPAALWQGQEVSVWAAGLAMLGIAWFLMPLPKRWRLMAWPSLLFLLWPNSMSQTWPAPVSGQVQVVAADIGQGTAVLIRTHRHALLYDTGARYSDTSDMGLRVLVGMLRTMGVMRLDEMLISHADTDHVGGAASVLANVPVAVLRSSLPANHSLFQAPSIGGRPSIVTCLAGQRWHWDGVDFEVLYPPENISITELEAEGNNATSCVLRIQAQAKQVLLTGDIEAKQEAQLLMDNSAKLRSTILLVPHHGSKTSSTSDFLAAVSPEMAVIQSGKRNRYGHPHPKVVARYQGMGVALVNTADCGAWLWQSDRPSTGKCWRENLSFYWQN